MSTDTGCCGSAYSYN